MDRQNSRAIKRHIKELCEDYKRSGNKLVLDFIKEWTEKYNLKLIEENERFNRLPTS